MQFYIRAYQRANAGRLPARLREDFAGTMLVSVEWVRQLTHLAGAAGGGGTAPPAGVMAYGARPPPAVPSLACARPFSPRHAAPALPSLVGGEMK